MMATSVNQCMTGLGAFLGLVICSSSRLLTLYRAETPSADLVNPPQPVVPLNHAFPM
jgi:hypothetical protein